jgi:hypothetical protein
LSLRHRGYITAAAPIVAAEQVLRRCGAAVQRTGAGVLSVYPR